jgi:hypothetical protein
VLAEAAVSADLKSAVVRQDLIHDKNGAIRPPLSLEKDPEFD